jgi:alcohol dehydrogenase class IV
VWYFKTPEYYFGQGALRYLRQIRGERAFIVSDQNVLKLGYVDLIQKYLGEAGIASQFFAEVEPDPSLETVHLGTEALRAFKPDWIISLGGGSCIDAAKGMWLLYERPDLQLEMVDPIGEIGLGEKALLMAIPTTAGSGSESGYGLVLTDTATNRKLTLANRDIMASLVIVDPLLSSNLPAHITADTGIDVLNHAIEGYSCTFANDFNDGLALHAAKIVFEYLPRAVANGNDDNEAREKMANAAAIAGMSLGNSAVALGHTLGHSAGPFLRELSHGRITAIFVPYTVEFNGNESLGRYRGLAKVLNLDATNEKEASFALAAAMRDLMREVNLPTSLKEAGIDRRRFEELLPTIVEHADVDPNIVQSLRIPATEEIEQLLLYAYAGKRVDF